tara:strand:+ start:13581 stop:13802 length:222 start_codon:yes stop_codon:yes gene_type:complete
MYVCICNAFTCGDVRKLKIKGVSKSVQVYKKLGCKMQCGKCLETIESVLNENADIDKLNSNEIKNKESSPLSA